MFAGKKSAQIREILISESAWEEMTCLFAPSLAAGHGQFFTQDSYNLHALVSEKLARVLSETPTSPTMKLFRNTNDKWELVDSLTDTALLRSWIAGQQENLIEI